MSILITSDWQLDDNPLNAYRHDWQKQLRGFVKKYKVDTVLMLGDVCEQKDNHGAWLVNKVVDHFDQLRKLVQQVIILRGNHDYVDARVSFYQFMRHMPRVMWINEPHTMSVQALGRVLMLPQAVDWKEEWKGLKLKSYDWVFTHITFQSAHAGHGFQLKGVPHDTFGKAQVVAGDIHIPQQITPRVRYVGSPYLCDFGDRFEPRVLLIDNEQLRSVFCTGPQKRLIEITSLSQLKPGNVQMRYINKGDILKVRLLITADSKAQWPELKAQVREWGEKEGYQIHVVQPILLDTLRGHRTGKKKTKQQQLTDEDLLRSYGKHHGIDKTTMTAGFNILKRI